MRSAKKKSSFIVKSLERKKFTTKFHESEREHSDDNKYEVCLPTIPESIARILNTPIKMKLMITSTSFDEGGSTTNKRKRQRYLSQLKAR